MELSSEDITHDFFPFLRVFKDGRLERYILTSSVAAGVDYKTGAESKDIDMEISSDMKLRGRIFLPKIDEPKKLPLLLHYHGGGFCTGSAFGPITKQSLSNFVTSAQAVALSVDYRLAPEHPLPTAYDDSWEALRWVATHCNGDGPEPWLNEYVDFNRVYLGGESAGANIAHDVAVRASVAGVEGIKLVGLSIVHPYFGCGVPDKLYKYLYPTSSGADDEPRLNPGVDPRLDELKCDKILVCVAGNDSLRDRGVSYFEALLRSGWRGRAEFMETEGEDHCFHLFNSCTESAKPLLCKLAAFME